MIEMGIRLVLAGVLAGAAIAKLARPRAGRAALAGIRASDGRRPGARFWAR